jgi:predicted glycogen debranching enzyme
MLRIGRKDLQNLETALDREWLETNALGGYASSTVLGVNTRRQHGLLVAALKPPVDRMLMVSRVDEVLIIGDARFELAASEYKDTIYPDGFRYLEDFRLDPFPTFTYVVGGVKLTKSIFMVHGENTTCVSYALELRPDGPRRNMVRLEVRPILALRDHNALTTEEQAFDRTAESAPGALRFRLSQDLPALHLAFGKGTFVESGYWYRGYHYRRDCKDGYPADEDLYSPGVVTFSFAEVDRPCIVFSAGDEACALPELEAAEIGRRVALGAADGPGAHRDALARHRLGKHLLAAADAFIVRRSQEGRSIIAGYPWFADWGRDSMVGLPGLTIATGNYHAARQIISTCVSEMSHGLIPNFFSDLARNAEYNTFDATLWLFEAARKYHDATGDGDFIASILPSLRDAMRAYLEGTSYGIRADEDGLLSGGTESTQLTWMDAKAGDRAITPRAGKPVEVNALWYNALRIMAELCSDFGGLAEERRYGQLAAKVFDSFNRQFWDDTRGCLFDCLGSGQVDDSVRPNQVFAISLTYPVLEPSRWKRVIEVVERELLTPYGLRTLSPNDPRYRGICEGNLDARDAAYHQGTVWAWLIGPYITAYLRAHGSSKRAVVHCSRLLEPFVGHLSEAGLGQISEIFDGDPPHRPRGSIAQAWSVAEILRVLSEHLLADHPAGQSHQPSTALNKPAKSGASARA